MLDIVIYLRIEHVDKLRDELNALRHEVDSQVEPRDTLSLGGIQQRMTTLSIPGLLSSSAMEFYL